MDVTSRFLERSAYHLREEYLPRLERAVAALPPDDLWWRPHAGSNSVGNLLLHLEGNVRQWILSGLGRRADHRNRTSEFDAREGHEATALLARLQETVEEACEVILAAPPDTILEPRRIQCFDVDPVSAIYHVVEHFAWHTGQITFVAKMRAGAEHGVSFYEGLPLDQTGVEIDPAP